MKLLTLFDQTRFVRQRISSATSRETMINEYMFYATLFMTQGPGLHARRRELVHS